MFRINNALIIDDKASLITSDLEVKEDYEFKSLQGIKNYFLKNSIPFSIVNNLDTNTLEAIEQIKNIPKPDLVVLDLDLNSDGEIDETDIRLLVILLKELKLNFDTFIIMIYSSQVEKWDEIRETILKDEIDFKFLLQKENIITSKKRIDFGISFNEILTAELFEKTERYFSLIKEKISKGLNILWNKEIVFFAILFISFLVIIFYAFPGLSYSMLITSILIIILVTFRFIIPDQTFLKKIK